MNWNREEVRLLLNAEITDEQMPDGQQFSTVRFKDSLMTYELLIVDGWPGVFLAADNERPIQGLPFFEISLPCTLLAPLPRTGMPTGLGIFSGSPGPGTIRFSITRREDSNISLSGAWDGLIAPVPLIPPPELPPASNSTAAA